VLQGLRLRTRRRVMRALPLIGVKSHTNSSITSPVSSTLSTSQSLKRTPQRQATCSVPGLCACVVKRSAAAAALFACLFACPVSRCVLSFVLFCFIGLFSFRCFTRSAAPRMSRRLCSFSALFAVSVSGSARHSLSRCPTAVPFHNTFHNKTKTFELQKANSPLCCAVSLNPLHSALLSALCAQRCR
jgi:hypothetical protein